MVIGPPGERDSDNLDCVGKDDLKASHNGHSCRGLQLHGPNQAVLVMGERKDEKGGKSDRNIPDCTGKERFEKIPSEMEKAPPHKLVSFLTHCFVAKNGMDWTG